MVWLNIFSSTEPIETAKQNLISLFTSFDSKHTIADAAQDIIRHIFTYDESTTDHTTVPYYTELLADEKIRCYLLGYLNYICPSDLLVRVGYKHYLHFLYKSLEDFDHNELQLAVLVHLGEGGFLQQHTYQSVLTSCDLMELFDKVLLCAIQCLNRTDIVLHGLCMHSIACRVLYKLSKSVNYELSRCLRDYCFNICNSEDSSDVDRERALILLQQVYPLNIFQEKYYLEWLCKELTSPRMNIAITACQTIGCLSEQYALMLSENNTSAVQAMNRLCSMIVTRNEPTLRNAALDAMFRVIQTTYTNHPDLALSLEKIILPVMDDAFQVAMSENSSFMNVDYIIKLLAFCSHMKINGVSSVKVQEADNLLYHYVRRIPMREPIVKRSIIQSVDFLIRQWGDSFSTGNCYEYALRLAMEALQNDNTYLLESTTYFITSIVQACRQARERLFNSKNTCLAIRTIHSLYTSNISESPAIALLNNLLEENLIEKLLYPEETIADFIVEMMDWIVCEKDCNLNASLSETGPVMFLANLIEHFLHKLTTQDRQTIIDSLPCKLLCEKLHQVDDSYITVSEGYSFVSLYIVLHIMGSQKLPNIRSCRSIFVQVLSELPDFTSPQDLYILLFGLIKVLRNQRHSLSPGEIYALKSIIGSHIVTLEKLSEDVDTQVLRTAWNQT